MSDLSVIIPVLKFRKMSDTEVLEYGTLRKQDIDSASVFASVEPSVSDLDAQLTAYSDALNAHMPGDKHSTRVKNDEKRKLKVMLNLMAWSCADIADGDFTAFSLTGFAAKQKGVAHTSMETPLLKGVFDGPIPNTLLAKFKGVPYKLVYEMQISTDDAFTPGATTKLFCESVSKVVIPDLESEVRYYIRVRAVGARGLRSDWSLTADRMVQ